MKPFFSVCMPTYNRAHFLPEAIESVLRQSFKDFELIIYDDGSVDDTASVVSKFKDSRIRYVKGSVNKGRPYARNRCINLAQGTWIIWLDDDDKLDKYLLELYRESINEFKMVEVFYVKKVVVLEENKLTLKEVNDFYSLNDFLTKVMFISSPIPNPASCIKKDLYNKFGLYDTEFERAEDYEFWTRIFPEVERKAVDYPGVIYRIHENQASDDLILIDTSYESLVKRRFLKKYLLLKENSESISDCYYTFSNYLIEIGDFFNASFFLWSLKMYDKSINMLRKAGILQSKEKRKLLEKYSQFLITNPSVAIDISEKLGLSYTYLALALSLKGKGNKNWEKIYKKAFVVNPLLYIPDEITFIPLSASRIARKETFLEEKKYEFLDWINNLEE